MIIDAHCHAGRGDGLTGPWDTAAPLGHYLRRARKAGIEKTNLFAAFHSDYAVANEEVGRIVRRRPDRFFGFTFVNARADAGRIYALVESTTRRFGFCGIKLHRHDARITREVCEVARHFALPVLYDVMGDVSAVELFSAQYESVDFIIPHLGSFADDWSAQTAFISILAERPNVFTDTSGVRRFDVLLKALTRAGPAKVLFGTDGPWLHPGVELAKVRLLGLPSGAESLVLGGNFLRLTHRARCRPRRQPPAADRPADAAVALGR